MASEQTTRLFTVDEYYRMAEAGILGEDDRVELLDGRIVQMSPIGSRHAACVDRLTRRLAAVPEGRAVLRVQSPVRLGKLSEPQPDLCLLKPRANYYADGHPGPEDVLLLIEVASTSLPFDRDVKLPLYARAEIPEVWLFDLEAERVHVFLEPIGDAYGSSYSVGPEDRLIPRAFPRLDVSVSAPLP
jgi:Uma2 family endonuclease